MVIRRYGSETVVKSKNGFVSIVKRSPPGIRIDVLVLRGKSGLIPVENSGVGAGSFGGLPWLQAADHKKVIC